MTLAEEAAGSPDLARYLDEYRAATGKSPRLVDGLTGADDADLDIVYGVGGPIYVHIHAGDEGLCYTVVEPTLDAEDIALLPRVKERIFHEAQYRPPPVGRDALERDVTDLFLHVTTPGRSPGKVPVGPERAERLLYHLIRDIARYGPLEAVMKDPYLEDIQQVGTEYVHVIHKFYDMLRTNIRFPDARVLDAYLRNLSERIGRPVSDARPIVDATLFDGSRINIVYSDDVSRKGPSFSIRRVQDEPITITQLIQWRTLTPEIAAYLWLCLENSMSVFVCGEAASGKSTTLNATLAFVNPRSKLYTAEDTPELRPPHAVWQRLITRETGPDDARVKMFDLLRAALRSRPNYIVVGEIRGAEGAVAFQAMQTGHPTMASFHASNKVKMIQRLTSEPINIPLTFIDNLNVAVFQQALYKNGRLVRRVTSVDEIEGYSALDGGVVTRPVFTYDPAKDQHTFKGNNNSFILERKIAEQHGYEDPRQIYEELQQRAKVLAAMTARKIFHHEAVNRLLFAYADKGMAAFDRMVAA